MRSGPRMPAEGGRPPELDPLHAAPLLANLGFIASSDLPARPGPAYLLVALRPEPTLHHYDPERVGYWVTAERRGAHRTLTRDAPLPLECEFSWGPIQVVDRLGISNEFLAFGGHLAAASVAGGTVAVFTSPAPLLRRGGHSQGWDHGAQSIGAFFGRLLVAVDFIPGFEVRLAQAGPLVRYSAFLDDIVARYRTSPELRSDHAELWALIQSEERRMRRDHPLEWSDREALLSDNQRPVDVLLR